MGYDYSKLEGRIKEVFGGQSNFAKAMELSERSVSLKINGIRGWKQPEMIRACELLGVEVSEIPAYFFTLKVQRS